MPLPLIRRYQALEEVWFNIYEIFSKTNFKLYVEDGFMTVRCKENINNLNTMQSLAWSIAIYHLEANDFEFRIEQNGMLIFGPDNLYLMNDFEEGFCIIHKDDLLDFDERQIALEDDHYEYDDEEL
jgi:hypothetical protein